MVAKELPSALRGKLAETIVSFDDDLTSSFGGSKSKMQDQANLSTRRRSNLFSDTHENDEDDSAWDGSNERSQPPVR